MNIFALSCGFAAALSLRPPAPAASLAYSIVPRQSFPDSCGWAVLSGLLGIFGSEDADSAAGNGTAAETGATDAAAAADGAIPESCLLRIYRDGCRDKTVSLAEMGHVLEDFGVQSVPLLASLDAILTLMQEGRPVVLHLDGSVGRASPSRTGRVPVSYGHYVLGIGARDGLATVADPAAGIRSMPFGTLDALWSGAALMPFDSPREAMNAAGHSVPPPCKLQREAVSRASLRYRFLERTAGIEGRGAASVAKRLNLAVSGGIGRAETTDGADPLYGFTIQADAELSRAIFARGMAGIALSRTAGPDRKTVRAFSFGFGAGRAWADPANSGKFAAILGLSLRDIRHSPGSGTHSAAISPSADPGGSETGAPLFSLAVETGAAATWLSDPLAYSLEARAEVSFPLSAPKPAAGKMVTLSFGQSVLCAVTGDFAFEAALRQEISIGLEAGAGLSFAAETETGVHIGLGEFRLNLGAAIGILSCGEKTRGGSLLIGLSTRL